MVCSYSMFQVESTIAWSHVFYIGICIIYACVVVVSSVVVVVVSVVSSIG